MVKVTRKKWTLQDMNDLAQKYGGKCLSDSYINGKIPLTWECSEGHKFQRIAGDIIYKEKWCKYCNGHWNIDRLKELAESKGGKCLSTEYENYYSLTKWECSKNHVWETPAYNVLANNVWCKECNNSKSTKKRTIDEMKEIAEKRGGKCLSEEYKNSKTKLLWECSNGHVWSTIPNVILRGFWCDKCKRKHTENKCRFILEFLLKDKFLTTREVLDGLELDGFNKKLNLAFEYQGIQHYKYIPFFHKSEEAFHERCQVDKLKRNLCKEKGILLLEIPYTQAKTDNKLISFIQNELINLGVLKKFNHDIQMDVFYKNNSTLQELNELANERGGELLSTEFEGYDIPITWKCSNNHTWEASAGSIKHLNSWCPHCHGNARGTIEEMKELAESRGGKCLSTVYINNSELLLWECDQKHQWHANAQSVKSQGHWCHDCGGSKPLTLEVMHEIAKSRGGKCLSTVYVNNKTNLTWECAAEHVWEATAHSVKDGDTWCSICSNKSSGEKRRLGIEKMHEIAKENGGKCLSQEYVGNKEKLKWECSEKHQWESSAFNVKNKKNWCPKCKEILKKEKYLGVLRKLAISKGGKCLSKIYVNNTTKLKWECAQKHQWEATPASVKDIGRWCEDCDKLIQTKKKSV